MGNLERLAINIESGFRLFSLGIRELCFAHTHIMDDPPELFALHVKADNIDSAYYDRLRETIKTARKRGIEDGHYSSYKNLLKNSIKHPGYKSIYENHILIP